MKSIITILILALSLQAFSQDPILQKNDDTLHDIAMELSEKYNKQLSLDGEQFILFQKKIEEFLIREEKIHNRFSGKEKLDMIYKLRKAETMEMRNILTRIQFNVYKDIKQEYQPIAIIRK